MPPITPEQRKALQEAAQPLMQWLRDNLHPHAYVLVDTSRAEVLEGWASVLYQAPVPQKILGA